MAEPVLPSPGSEVIPATAVDFRNLYSGRGRPGQKPKITEGFHQARQMGAEALIQFVFNHSIPVPFSGCWIWLYAMNHEGYSMVYEYEAYKAGQQARLMVHRIVCECRHGPMQHGMVTRHTCDVSSCVNPDHLIPGTDQDNADDMWTRGRGKPLRGDRNGRATITNDDALKIRNSLHLSNKELAARFNTTYKVIWRIRHGESWASVN